MDENLNKFRQTSIQFFRKNPPLARIQHVDGKPRAAEGQSQADLEANARPATVWLATKIPTPVLKIHGEMKRMYDALNYISRLYDGRITAYSN
jgi:hypothetical protein